MSFKKLRELFLKTNERNDKKAERVQTMFKNKGGQTKC